jgi:hypothetical protein
VKARLAGQERLVLGKQSLLVIGTLIVLGGLVLASMGGHKIIRNLPLSEEAAMEEAKSALLDRQGVSGEQGVGSYGGRVEVEIWKSARGTMNELRREKRVKGSVFLVSGIASVIWGLTVLYASRSTPKT